MLLRKDDEDWDLLLPQIMQTIRASPYKKNTKITNFMMLEWKARLPEHLYMPAVDKASSRKSYPVKLATKMNTAHEKLRAQHLQL